MPKYVIEREVPGAGKMTSEELKNISQTSCGVLRNMGPEIQWVHSYVTGDKIYCIYNDSQRRNGTRARTARGLSGKLGERGKIHDRSGVGRVKVWELKNNYQSILLPF